MQQEMPQIGILSYANFASKYHQMQEACSEVSFLQLIVFICEVLIIYHKILEIAYFKF